jgi:hypothetical protein
MSWLQPGIQKLFAPQKPLPTSFIENLLVFSTKFKIWNLGERNKKTEQFLKNRVVFLVYWSTFGWFLFKIQIMNENSKLLIFLVYCLVFFGLSLDFFSFWFSKFLKILFFLHCNRPVFGEPNKPDRTGFVGFRRYLNSWLQHIHICKADICSMVLGVCGWTSNHGFAHGNPGFLSSSYLQQLEKN